MPKIFVNTKTYIVNYFYDIYSFYLLSRLMTRLTHLNVEKCIKSGIPDHSPIISLVTTI
jgi:hypothetical protein